MTALDPRQQRTRERLTEAVLRLATQRPARDIGMAELAREAGVHRTTLYQHLRSPAEWLAEVLRGELDTLRERHLPNDGALASLSDATRDVVLGVLAHLEAHEALYRRELADPASPVGDMLAAHFAASVEQLLARHDLAPATRLPPEQFAAMAARWIGDASVGAMTIWLDGDRPRDPEAYLAAHALLLPPWWPPPTTPARRNP